MRSKPGVFRQFVSRRVGVSTDPGRDLVLVFDTSLDTGTTVAVPMHGTVDCTVDWGDGTSDSYTTVGDKTHTYASDGEYTVRVSGLLTGFGSSVERLNLTKCLSFGEIGITSLSSAFQSCANFIQAPMSLPSESSVTNISNAMRSCPSFNQKINWNTSTVSSFLNFLLNATSFNQDIGSFDLSSAVDLRGMISGTNLSVENYSRTLIGFANFVSSNGGPFGRNFGASGLQYNNTAYTTGETYNDAVSARNYLTTATGSGGAGWTVTDGGELV